MRGGEGRGAGCENGVEVQIDYEGREEGRKRLGSELFSVLGVLAKHVLARGVGFGIPIWKKRIAHRTECIVLRFSEYVLQRVSTSASS